MGKGKKDNHPMLSIGREIANEIKIKFGITDYLSRQLAIRINNAIKSTILRDGRYRYPSGVKKKEHTGEVPKNKPKPKNTTPDTRKEILEMEKLRLELEAETKNHFHKRVYSQETEKKIKRLIFLENKFKK